MNKKPQPLKQPQEKLNEVAENTDLAPQDLITHTLLAENYVSQKDIDLANSYIKKNGGTVTEYLLREGLLTQELLNQAVAESFHVPYANLKLKQPTRENVLKIPEEVARRFHVLVAQETDSQVTVATDDPSEAERLSSLKSIFPSKEIVISYASYAEIEQYFLHYRKSLESRFEEIVTTGNRIAPEMLKEIFKDSISYHASDIHFEPQEEKVIIRFRIDGVLQQVGTIEKELYDNLLNRIKVRANLRIDEHFAAQDGSMQFTNDEMTLDMRISIIPTLNGEKIAIRVLSSYVQSFSLEDLGLSATHKAILDDAATKPFGMILVTGPTGSGKTTTLYALLKLLNRPEVNITTIEDPVEYRITGINQIQVNTATNLTFAQGLRSIVRQDPNIILVGEIRDLETAEIAVNAALTGHLLLSTFHANDAATAIPRLLEIGIEPFLLASTLELVIAQRLVRRICESCRFSESASLEDIKKKFPAVVSNFSGKTVTLYKGKGCDACSRTGYRGRIAVHEFITITPEMEELILTNPSAQQIGVFAEKQGAASMFLDGIEKVKNGVTTIEELMRVAAPPVSKSKNHESKSTGKK